MQLTFRIKSIPYQRLLQAQRISEIKEFEFPPFWVKNHKTNWEIVFTCTGEFVTIISEFPGQLMLGSVNLSKFLIITRSDSDLKWSPLITKILIESCCYYPIEVPNVFQGSLLTFLNIEPVFKIPM